MNNTKKRLTTAQRKLVNAAIIAIVILAIVGVNVLTTLLVNKFPNLQADVTTKGAYTLNATTEEFLQYMDNEVKVTVGVENIGSYDIDENILLFVSAKNCIITPFVKRLRAFKKVSLAKGEKKTVEFTLTEKDFTYIDFDMKTAVNRGAHRILIADKEVEFDF